MLQLEPNNNNFTPTQSIFVKPKKNTIWHKKVNIIFNFYICNDLQQNAVLKIQNITFVKRDPNPKFVRKMAMFEHLNDQLLVDSK